MHRKTLFYALVFFFSSQLIAAQKAYIIDEDVPVYADPEMTKTIGKVRQGTELLVGVPAKANPKALPTVSNGKIVYVREGDTSFTPQERFKPERELSRYRAPGSVGKAPLNSYYTTIGLTLGLVSFEGQNYINALSALYPDTGLSKRRDHFPFPKIFAEGHFKESFMGWQVALSFHYNNQDVIAFKSTMLDFVFYYSPFQFLIDHHLTTLDFMLGFSILPYFEVENPLAKRDQQTGFYGPMIGAQLRMPIKNFELQLGLQFAKYYSNGVDIVNEKYSELNSNPSSITLKKLSSYNLYFGAAYRL